jgi:hypothetical protein
LAVGRGAHQFSFFNFLPVFHFQKLISHRKLPQSVHRSLKPNRNPRNLRTFKE